MGGYSVFGKGASATKTLTELPSHDMLRVRLQFWKIDSWDTEMAFIKVDGRAIWAAYFN